MEDLMDSNRMFEELVNNTGGCGRYQWIITFLIQLAKTSVCWSMIHMTFNGQQPGYECESWANTTGIRYEGTCDPENYTCDARVYSDDMNTIVNEWDLVCDNKWIVAMVTTIQMSGVLVGCFVAGILGDMIGRKPTFFLSLCLVIVFNVIAYFSVSWEMYAAVRFGIGLGCGFYLTVQINLMTEFMPTIWRPRAIAIPGWSLESGLYALVVWLIKDWKYIHLATAAVGMPFLLSFFFVQESSRWLITKQRYKDAENSIGYIAKVNGREVPDVSKIITRAESEFQTKDKPKVNVSFLDLVRTGSRARITFSLFFIWFAVSCSGYALLFGIGTLSGDLYRNMFVTNIIGTPVKLSMFLFVNRIGRKASCFGLYFITGIFALIVGIIQYVDTPLQGVITNFFAYGCKMTLSAAWVAMMVYTTELYPTTVRNTAYGLHNTAARVGGMIAPQIVFLNDYVDGLLYFVAAALMLISAFLWCQFPETKGQPLRNRYDDKEKHGTPSNKDKHATPSNKDKHAPSDKDKHATPSNNSHINGQSNHAFDGKEIVFEQRDKETVEVTEKDVTSNTRL